MVLSAMLKKLFLVPVLSLTLSLFGCSWFGDSAVSSLEKAEEEIIREKLDVVDPLETMPELVYEGEEILFDRDYVKGIVQKTNLGYALKEITEMEFGIERLPTVVGPDDFVDANYEDGIYVNVFPSDIFRRFDDYRVSNLEIDIGAVDTYFYGDFLKGLDIGVLHFDFPIISMQGAITISEAAFAFLDEGETEVIFKNYDVEAIRYLFFLLDKAKFASGVFTPKVHCSLTVDMGHFTQDGNIGVYEAALTIGGEVKRTKNISKYGDENEAFLGITLFDYEIDPWEYTLENVVRDEKDGSLTCDTEVKAELSAKVEFKIANYSPFHWKNYSYSFTVNGEYADYLAPGVYVDCSFIYWSD